MDATSEKMHVILTGGRIDSVWDGDVDEIVVAEHSEIPDFFKNIKVGLDFVHKLHRRNYC